MDDLHLYGLAYCLGAPGGVVQLEHKLGPDPDHVVHVLHDHLASRLVPDGQPFPLVALILVTELIEVVKVQLVESDWVLDSEAHAVLLTVLQSQSLLHVALGPAQPEVHLLAT